MRKTFPRRAAPLLAAGFALCAAAGCGGGSANTGTLLTREALAIEGSVDLVGSPALDLAVDPGLRVVYVSGGFGQLGILRVDVSDPAHPTATAFAPGFGGGVAVDPTTHRVATTDAYGVTNAALGVFEPTGAAYDSEGLTGCGGALASDPGGGRFGVSTQCVDTFHIYDQARRAVIFVTATAGVGSNVVFNGAADRWYQSRTPRFAAPRNTSALVVEPSGAGGFTTSDFPIDGSVHAVDAVHNRLWFGDDYATLSAGGLFLLDATTHAPIGPAGVTLPGRIAVADAIGRVYHYDGTFVRLLEADTGALVDTLDLGAATGGYVIQTTASDGERAYAIGSRSGGPNRLFVIARTRVRR